MVTSKHSSTANISMDDMLFRHSLLVIISHKPNILSIGFRTFAVKVKAAKKYNSLSYLCFAPYLHSFSIKFIYTDITDRENSWVADKKVKFWVNQVPYLFLVLSKGEVILAGSIFTLLAVVSVQFSVVCITGKPLFRDTSRFHWDFPRKNVVPMHLNWGIRSCKALFPARSSKDSSLILQMLRSLVTHRNTSLLSLPRSAPAKH